ncbi:MAG: thiamine pyridinylase [Symploca sp. SIO1C2]|nr:thiamine pyridinylase [Symploca sp. SIO1C2]
MKKLINFSLMLVLALVVTFVAIGESSASASELKVGLYPYVPRLDQFKNEITKAWNDKHNDVTLNFIDWDGGYDSYHTEPTADVYVFDAMFFDLYKSNNWLEPMYFSEVENKQDFYEYAKNGVIGQYVKDGVTQGEKYFAIPQLGCSNVLFYRKNDQDLANATNLQEMNQALQQCQYTSDIPPDQRGLMLDMEGGTTNAVLYLDTVYKRKGIYPFELPMDTDALDNQGIDNMQELLAMASYDNATEKKEEEPDRAEMFSKGYGKAFMGYTEAMSRMQKDSLEDIGMKVMPLSQNDSTTSDLFYVDVVGVNPKTTDRANAVKLANLIASSEVIYKSLNKDEAEGNPQYLMPVRPSVMWKLAQEYPKYDEMSYMLRQSKPLMFKLSEESGNWLDQMKTPIKLAARQDYPCGCDVKAVETINNQGAAETICTETCTNHGGWNGQWTNEYPAALEGSVCGCQQCGL